MVASRYPRGCRLSKWEKPVTVTVDANLEFRRVAVFGREGVVQEGNQLTVFASVLVAPCVINIPHRMKFAIFGTPFGGAISLTFRAAVGYTERLGMFSREISGDRE